MQLNAPDALLQVQATARCQRPSNRPGPLWLFGPNERLFVAKGRSFPDRLPASATEAFCWLLCRRLGLSVPNAVALDLSLLRARTPECLEGLAGTLLFASEVPYREG